MIVGGSLPSNVSLSYGLEALAPTDPKTGEQYLCTDTKKLLVCYLDNSWTEVKNQSTINNVMVNALKIATLNNMTLQGINNGIVDTFTDSNNVLLTGLALSSGALVASGGKISAVGVIYDGYSLNYPASKVNDGSYSGGSWLATDGAINHYIGLDLGSVKTINKVKLYQNWSPDYGFDDFVIEVSNDNSNWSIVKTVLGYYANWTVGNNEFTFDTVACRYIRARGTNSNGQSYNGVLEEFEVFYDSAHVTVESTNIILDAAISQCNVIVLVDYANLADTTLSVSVDGGNTWVECSNVEKSTNQNNGYYLTGTATITDTGTQLRYKIESDSLSTVYGVGVSW